MTTQLKLTELIGQGRDRACYSHPKLARFCVKVPLTKDRQTPRERRYLAYLNKKGANLSAISGYYGEVATNLGQGYVFELMRLANGQIAPTLKEALLNGIISEKKLLSELHTLREYLSRNAICVRDLSPTNIVCRIAPDGHLEFKIIDGIGSPNHNPLTIRLGYLVERAINQAWQRLERKIRNLKTPRK